MIAPRTRNGPKGTLVFIFFPFQRISPEAYIAPIPKASVRAKIISGTPTARPITSASQASPQPIQVSLETYERLAKNAHAPNAAASPDIVRSSEITPIPLDIPKKSERRRDASVQIPAIQRSATGISIVRASYTAMMTKRDMSPRSHTVSIHATMSYISKKYLPMRRKRIPVTTSTTRYCQEIFSLHFRHLPRSKRNEKSGILSYQTISFPHFGHAERRETKSSSRSSDSATTLRKLPTISPRPRKKKEIIKLVYP